MGSIAKFDEEYEWKKSFGEDWSVGQGSVDQEEWVTRELGAKNQMYLVWLCLINTT
jgi:hypothetical protein